MLKETMKPTKIIYEGDDLKGCLWNFNLEMLDKELNLPDERFCELLDRPLQNFDHLNYLEILQELGLQFRIKQYSDCVQMVIQ
ncbi:MAG: hypothetical protein ACERLG_00745 [Sedimentibacter sp.]